MNYNNLCYGCFKEKNDTSYPCPFCGYDIVSEHPYSALPAGSVLGGRYMTGKVLGIGGFGITYLGFDLTLEIKVAIKEYMPQGISARTQDKYTVTVVTSKDKSVYETGAERFLDEARILAKLQNLPNIVSVQNYFKENNTAYFIMDYIEGMSLKDYLETKGGKISYDETILLLLPVMKVLDLVHKQNLLHRDISPDNIYITSSGESKLLDFGAARFSSNDNKSMSVILKHGYAPEEQYRSHGNQGPWSDVYAFGATIYYCITGTLPPDSIERVYNDVIVSPSIFGVKMPVYASDALMKALSVKPENRFQNMNEFIMAFAGSSDNIGKTVQSSGDIISDISKSNSFNNISQKENQNIILLFLQKIKTDSRFLILFVCCAAAVVLAVTIPLGIALSNKNIDNTFGKGGTTETTDKTKMTTVVSDTVKITSETSNYDTTTIDFFDTSTSGIYETKIIDTQPELPLEINYILKNYSDFAFKIKVPDMWAEESYFDGIVYKNKENTVIMEVLYSYQTIRAIYSIEDIAKSADDHLNYFLGESDKNESLKFSDKKEEYITIGSEQAYHLSADISSEKEKSTCNLYAFNSKNGFGCYIIFSVCYADNDFELNNKIISESVKSFSISGKINVPDMLHYQNKDKDIQTLYDSDLVTAINEDYYDNAVFFYIGNTDDLNTVGIFNVGNQYTQKGYFTDMEAGFEEGFLILDNDLYTIDVNQYIYYAKDYHYYDDNGILYYFTVCTVPIENSLYVVSFETMEYAVDDSVTLLGTIMHTLHKAK